MKGRPHKVNKVRRRTLPRKRCLPQLPPLSCWACNIAIGPGYETAVPFFAGPFIVCGNCRSKLEEYGYIRIDNYRKLLPDGTIIPFSECFSCGIGIGPGHDESTPSHAGDKIICGWCYGKLRKQGYLQIDELHRLLPNSSVIKFRRILPG